MTRQKGTNGSGQRKLDSWIESFVLATENTESPAIFRKWAAIATIAAVLEQKVWLKTSSPLYPNLFTMVIAPPGVGKSRIIDVAYDMITKMPDPFIAPTSVNAASIIDHMLECKRIIINMPEPPLEYNAMAILVGEFGTFMSKYEDDLLAILTDMFNVRPYGQRRRGGQLKIKMERPSLNMLIGSTPSNLMRFMPEGAWDQGFTSRIFFIYSNEKGIVDDFAQHTPSNYDDLLYDLRIINNLVGGFGVTDEYHNAVTNWRSLGEVPKPTHPRLTHYNSRRKEHLYRLSMVAAVNRSNTLILTKDDFNTAMGWMVEAEAAMPEIFRGTANGVSDNAVMEELHHYILDLNVKDEIAVSEHVIIREARKKLPANAVLRVVELMERSGMITVAKTDRAGIRYYAAIPKDEAI